jgi:hypothetical protein
MSDTYKKLVECRAANLVLQTLVNEHRTALVNLVRQPFSKTCVEAAKQVVLKTIDTTESQALIDDYMEMRRDLGLGDEP